MSWIFDKIVRNSVNKEYCFYGLERVLKTNNQSPILCWFFLYTHSNSANMDYSHPHRFGTYYSPSSPKATYQNHYRKSVENFLLDLSSNYFDIRSPRFI